jgi:glycerol kinase
MLKYFIKIKHNFNAVLGVWSGKEELRRLRRVEREFMPNPNSQRAYAPELERWEKAVQRFLAWHQI